MKCIYFMLAGLCALFCTVCSCSTGDTAAAAATAAAQALGASSQAPVFLACKAASETEIDFQFSAPVKVVSLRFSPALAIDSMEDGDTVRVTIGENPGGGKPYTADLLAEDGKGNTINVLVPFRTRNNRIPALRLNEIRTEHAKNTTKSGVFYKSEFIEFKMLSAGNLGALRVFALGNKNPLIYEFPPIEVANGEYVTLHLRTFEEECRDELGTNLGESGGTDSSSTARDLWIPGSAKLLHKTEVIYILDQDDRALDAVMLSEDTASWGQNAFMADAADFLFKQGAWKSAEGNAGGPADAVKSANTANTRTICRDETKSNTNTAADWYITASSSATPGGQNNPKRYVPK